MESQSQQRPGEGFAGVYLRLGGHTRFWGWGTLAESAESLCAAKPDVQRPATTGTVCAGGDTGKPAVRFVCDRHCIGFVVR